MKLFQKHFDIVQFTFSLIWLNTDVQELTKDY